MKGAVWLAGRERQRIILFLVGRTACCVLRQPFCQRPEIDASRVSCLKSVSVVLIWLGISLGKKNCVFEYGRLSASSKNWGKYGMLEYQQSGD
jgi:hypothetical protein